MTLPSLTLTMDKRTNSQQKLHLRQSERGLSLTAQLLDYDGTPYDLTGMLVRFKDAKAGGKSVSDDNVTVSTDPKTGVVTYPVHSQVFAANGIGWFEIYSDAVTLIDSTQNIPIVVEKDISGTIDNNDYVSGLNGLQDKLQGIVNSAQQTLDNAVSGANTATAAANTAAQAAQALANDIPNNPKYRGPVGQTGPQGGKGDKGDTGATGPVGPVGPIGPVGPSGKDGRDGKDGTGIQLKGSADSTDKLPTTGNTDGDTYLVAGHLYIWENDAWTDGGELQGPKGDDGRSAYQVWLDAGNTGTESDYLASLIGATGAPGTKGDTGNTGATGPAGPAGESAYQVWLDAGNTGTESDYLASLKGAAGPAGKDGSGSTVYDNYNVLTAETTPSTLTTPGRYWLSYKVKNGPTGVNFHAFVDVYATADSSVIFQRLYGADNKTLWYNCYYNNAWAGWTQTTSTTQVQAAIDAAFAQYKPVKSISVNGGTPANPDTNGNVNVSVTLPDLTPYLTSADAANTYQTKTQVQAQVDAKIVSVADETTATSNSATNTTVLYLVPEAS